MNRFIRSYQLVVIAVGCAVLYWVAESALDTLVRGTFFSRLLPLEAPNELWMRAITVSLLLGFGASAQVLTNRRKRAEEEVRRLNAELEGRVVERTARLEDALAEVRDREQRLEQSEERYRSFVEQSTEGIWRFELEQPVPADLPEDEQMDLFYRHAYLAECNDAMARMYGFEHAQEILGARLHDLLPRSVPQNVEYLRAFIRSGYRLSEAESEEADREGNTRYFLNNLTGIVEDGLLVRAWGTQRDVTERRRAAEVQRFLAEASDVLSSSLDYRETLSSVARLAVPTLSDWCVVDILTEDGSLERLAVEHQDPRKVELAYKVQERYPPDPDAPQGLHHVIRSGEPDMMTEIPGHLIERAASNEEHRELLRELGFRSYMLVPLVARGRTLGAISFVSAESGRRYGDDDLQLARELARRAALAVDNTWLYGEAQRELAERRWAEEELRASRDQLEIILRGIADGVTAQDLTGRVIYANDAAARISGYPSARAFVEAPMQEVMSKFELRDEEGRPFPTERLPGRRALQGEEGAEEVMRLRVVETGQERWSIVKAVPVFDEQGKVRLAVNIFRDITERKHAEETLRARARQQEAVAWLGRQALVTTDVQTLMEEAVELVARTLDVEYSKIVELLPDGGELLLRAGVGWREGLVGHATEDAGQGSQTGYTLLLGEPLIVEDLRTERRFEPSPLLRDHGVVSGMTAIIRGRERPFGVIGAHTRELRSFTDDDINFLRAIANVLAAAVERKRVEDAVRETRESERRRIARDLHDGVLQDLSYTVQAMQLTELNAQGTGLEQELQEEVNALRNAAQELRAAVHDLRLADELDQAFPRLLESLVERNRAMARTQQIRLEIEGGVSSEPLGEQGIEVLRILQEALTNARRHSGASNVVVSLRAEDGYLIVEVRDDGRGMGAGRAPGVGMRSMRERAAALGGELEVESEPQEGTTVRLRIPMLLRAQ